MLSTLVKRLAPVLVAILTLLPYVAHADEAPTDQTADPVDQEPVFDPLDPETAFRDIVFPVVGPTAFSATYGACRDGCARTHMGTDITTYGWKGHSVVAAHDGQVTAVRTDGELSGCSVEITADDDWSTRYLHLNNDFPGTDLATDRCVAPGIEVGTRIDAGTLLGWIGDSGNAESTTPHLHFEIRNPDGMAVEPWFSLIEARRIEFTWIGAGGLASISASIFDSAAPSAIVLEVSDLPAIAAAGIEPAHITVPVIAFDRSDPEPAATELRRLSPDRILILTDDEDPQLAIDMAAFAPIIDIDTLTQTKPDPAGTAPTLALLESPLPKEDPTTTEDDSAPDAPAGEPGDAVFGPQFDPVDHRLTIIVAGRSSDLPRRTSAMFESGGLEHRVVFLDMASTPRGDFGPSGGAQPDDHADRNLLWWNTAHGWLSTDSLTEIPQTGVAYVSTRTATPWTVAYLTSLGVSPPMPLWHHDPGHRPSPSL